MIEYLKQKIQTREVFEIVYHGGSKPGGKREIVAINISGDKLRAHCMITDMTKTFLIEKIQVEEIDRHQNFDELDFQSEIIKTANSLNLKIVDEANDCLFIYRPKKRGTGYLKHPFASIIWEEWNEELNQPRVKPFTIRFEKFETKSFKLKEKALNCLYQYLKEYESNTSDNELAS
ncbi:MAG: hypothetical protein VX642_04380 [Bdellovibrionota bacterium]|nr:hypothetical protein [Bdellovibrionota bacterium]